ncbi:hypothetical protein CB1_000526054 [Camelus ferus]|nr:hypothetical protein CB1_000526054 [Camelus ferus]
MEGFLDLRPAINRRQLIDHLDIRFVSSASLAVNPHKDTGMVAGLGTRVQNPFSPTRMEGSETIPAAGVGLVGTAAEADQTLSTQRSPSPATLEATEVPCLLRNELQACLESVPLTAVAGTFPSPHLVPDRPALGQAAMGRDWRALAQTCPREASTSSAGSALLWAGAVASTSPGVSGKDGLQCAASLLQFCLRKITGGSRPP